MPSLTLDDNPANYQIRAYQPGAITVNDKILFTSVIVTPNVLIENWQPVLPSDITADTLAEIITLKPDILLIGTGATQTFLSPEVYGELINLGIGIEVMNTSAACRTYNALTAEYRNVAAALLVK